MPMPAGGEFIDHREVERGAIGEIDQDLVLAVFEHVIESRAAPGLRRVALAGRPIFEHVALVGIDIAPAKPMPFANQRSQNPRTRSFSAAPARPWLTTQFIRFRRDVASIRYYAQQLRVMKRPAGGHGGW